MTFARTNKQRRSTHWEPMAILKWSLVSLGIFAFALAFVAVFSGMLSTR